MGSTGHTHTTHETMPKNLFDMLGDDLLSDVISHAAPNASRICYLRLQESQERGKFVFKKLKLYPNKQYDPWLKDGNVDMSVQELDIHIEECVSIPPMQTHEAQKACHSRRQCRYTEGPLQALAVDSLTHLSVRAYSEQKLITLLEKA